MRELDALIKQYNAQQEAAQYLACLSGGIAASAAYNAAGATKADGKPFTVADFLPGHHDEVQQQTPEEMLAALGLINDMHGGQRKVN
jgi:hypothetical protein